MLICCGVLWGVLHRAMANFNNLCPIEAVFLEYDFKPFTRMVDVGGGLGAFAAAALAAAPQLKAHLFDQPNVMKQAQEVGPGNSRPHLNGDGTENMGLGFRSFTTNGLLQTKVHYGSLSAIDLMAYPYKQISKPLIVQGPEMKHK